MQVPPGREPSLRPHLPSRYGQFAGAFHGRYLVFQMAEVAVPRELFGRILDRIAGLRPVTVARC